MDPESARLRATFVVLAHDAWERTRSGLDSLLGAIEEHDQVVVVDDASRDETAAELEGYPSVDVVSNRERRGAAVASNQGAVRARGDVIVFVDRDVLVSRGALEELLAAFEDPAVAAAGPRWNTPVGPQGVSDPERASPEGTSVLEFSEVWRARHHGNLSECDRLEGLCLAVRASAFRMLGGFDEGYVNAGVESEDLSMKLRSAGHRLFVADGSYVHRRPRVTHELEGSDTSRLESEGRRRFEEKWGLRERDATCLVSVCLIVKNEEELLGACLESIEDLADDIVVYDTGSTDDTLRIARAAGARVFEGYWDDSFSRARNVALAQARGTWVLSLDADETFLGDSKAVRGLLERQPSDVEAFLVAIENLHGAGNARSVHTAIRLFRRDVAEWRHRLHEQVVAADDHSRRLGISYLSPARIIHRGYVAEVFDARDKAQRNLALARAALDDEELSRAYALMNYGRALESAGQSVQAVEALAEAAEITGDPVTRRLAVKNLIYILGRLGRFEEALEQVDVLRRISAVQIAADIAEGTMRISMGESEAGLALLARVPARGRDDDGMEYTAHTLSALRGEALASLGRHGEAVDLVLDAMRAEGVLEADLGEVISWLAAAGRSAMEIVDVVDAADLMAVLGRALRQAPDVADVIVEGIWNRFPTRLEALAAAGRLGPRLPVARALVWSTRLRARGLAQACPLVGIARDAKQEPLVRIMAAAAAFASFGDLSVINSVHEARRALDPDSLAESTRMIERLAPGLLQAEHRDALIPPKPTAHATSSRSQRGHSASLTPTLKVAVRARRGGLNIVGPFEATSTEAHVARSVASALSSSGFDVSTTSYRASGHAGSAQWRHSDPGDFPFDTTLFLMTPEDLTNFVIDHGSTAFEGRYAIGMWLWDFERPSPIMATAARMVHEIWVPSAFARDAVARASERPIVTMHLPPGPSGPRSAPRANDAPFTFLASVDYSTGFERQNPLGVLSAFCESFDERDGSRLVIETANAHQYPSEHARLQKSARSRPDITIVDRTADAFGGVLDAYAPSRSCFVSLHRSEGTGRALMRAMSIGMPIIATNHSLASELLSEKSSFVIPSTLVPVPLSEHRCESGGRWAEPELDEAVQAMRWVMDEPTLATLKGKRAQDRARSLFAPARWSALARQRLAAIDQGRYGDVSSRRGRVASSSRRA